MLEVLKNIRTLKFGIILLVECEVSPLGWLFGYFVLSVGAILEDSGILRR